jgi:hypothetical protein
MVIQNYAHTNDGILTAQNSRKEQYSEKNLSQCHFINTNPICTGLGLNLSQHGIRWVTNHLNHDIAYWNLV